MRHALEISIMIMYQGPKNISGQLYFDMQKFQHELYTELEAGRQ